MLLSDRGKSNEPSSVPQRSVVDGNLTLTSQSESSSAQQLIRLMGNISPDVREFYFGQNANPSVEKDRTQQFVDLLVEFCGSSSMGETEGMNEQVYVGETDRRQVNRLYLMNRKVEKVHRFYRSSLPGNIWKCCKKYCIVKLATDESEFDVFDDVVRVHEVAMGLHMEVDACKEKVQTRRLGVGGSTMGFESASRREREMAIGQIGTDRRQALEELRNFVMEVLPYLHAEADSPTGGSRLKEALCTTAICGILRVSHNFIYARKESKADDGKHLLSLLDSCGLRRRQHRVKGERGNYPKILELPAFECGCEGGPCFAGVSTGRLRILFEEFCAISRQKKSARRKENQYLRNIMFSRLTNSTVKTCNLALSNLYTVSVERIASIRRVLDAMCRDPSLNDSVVISTGISAYSKNKRHPANRYSDDVRANVETYLDMVLRPDPSAEDGKTTYRVYSPDINTHEKLRKAVARSLEGNESVDVELSPSTLQRMINDYLRERNSRIKYLQSDHNACANCKTMQLSLLELRYAIKELTAKKKALVDCSTDGVDEEREVVSSQMELRLFVRSPS